MSGWLPITTRNRVALGLAALALVMFVVWNCLPRYPSTAYTEPDGIVAMFIWPDLLLSADPYINLFKNPDSGEFMFIAACFALIQNALVTLAVLPLWKYLHVSPYIRLPLAIANLTGGGLVIWLYYVMLAFLRYGNDVPPPYWEAVSFLMASSMFALSAALFTFKNEMALREERNRPITQ